MAGTEQTPGCKVHSLPHQQTTVCEAQRLCLMWWSTTRGPLRVQCSTSPPRHVGQQTTLKCHQQKFSYDTAIVGYVSEGNNLKYRRVIKNFVDWCECDILRIIASNTNEMVITFQRTTLHNAPTNIQGLNIDWTDNTDAL